MLPKLNATCPEFQGLWQYIVDWQKAFKYFDRDGSGTIDGHELADALRNFGYNLSPTLMSMLEQKYGKLRLGLHAMSKSRFLTRRFCAATSPGALRRLRPKAWHNL